MKVRYVGDIHGDYMAFLRASEGAESSVQVGDWGFGFGTLGQADFIDKFLDPEDGERRMIRGNHDSLEEALKSKHFIKDGTVEMIGDYKVMYVGGAYSIDRMWRTEGVDYWSNEELTQAELGDMISIYAREKPDVMVCHEVPESIPHFLKPVDYNPNQWPSRTRWAFEHMHSYHAPKLWIAGHWHLKKDLTHQGTRFIILNINQTIEVDYGDELKVTDLGYVTNK